MSSLQLPLFPPPSSWSLPLALPVIPRGEPIAVDLETNDPLLKEKGPSWRFGEGHVAGISVAWQRHVLYVPIAHLVGPNFRTDLARAWLADLFPRPRTYLANGLYDLGWLSHMGALPDNLSGHGRFVDVQVQAALLQEDHPQGYSLDALGTRFLKIRKDEKLLREAADAYGVNAKKDMWRLPPKFVGPYAEQDASLTLQLGLVLDELIAKESMQGILDLECETTKVLHAMHRQGIRFDLKKSEEINSIFLKKEKAIHPGFDVWSTPTVSAVLIKAGFALPKTDKGNYSCAKQVLKALASHGNLPDRILQTRHINRLRQTYVEDAAHFAFNGRVYPQYFQMGRDEGGTVTGRLAASNPNIQQVPKRSEEGKLIRQLYQADEGLLWGKADYSSQEPRLQVHFALASNLTSAEEARDAFHAGKKLYAFMEEKLAGRINYDQAKALVLGRSYGMGIETMSETVGVPPGECQRLLESFDEAFPYLIQLNDRVTATAKNRGWIRTLLGRRRHFDWWELHDRDRKNLPIFTKGAALAKWRGQPIRRAYTHKALNSLIQGSAADQTKAAMVRLFEEHGVVPYLQAHDELGLPLRPDSLQEDIKTYTELMATAVPNLLVRFAVDCDVAPHWQ